MKKHLTTEDRYDSQRGWFAWELYNQMVDNPDVWLITGDLGFGMFDRIKQDFPERFINVGAAEQSLIGVAVGLALEGKIPFAYSITPFLLYRPFETIRNYLHYESIAVKLVGSGRNADYEHDGLSHWTFEDKRIMEILSGIEAKWLETKEEIPDLVEEMIKNKKPYYLNLRR